VVLVKKNRPTWQAGRFNAVGGHVEKDERTEYAMEREFFEETGVKFEDWKLFVVLTGKLYVVYFYKGFSDKMFDCTTTIDESIHIVDIDLSKINCISNLRWLIPLALDSDGDYAGNIRDNS
jgi:8-oxo-dGTP diphosphatase